MMVINTIDLAALERRLKALPAELTGRSGGPLARALMAGANVIAAAAAFNAPVVTGRLASSYKGHRARNPELFNATEVVQIYSRVPYWHIVELGSAKQPVAQAPLRRAGAEQAGEAIDAFAAHLARTLAGMERRLAR